MLRFTKKTFAAFSVLSVLAVLSVLTPNASAVTASDWSAGKIMEDSIFFNPGDMSTGDIQNFLNSKVPVCDTNGTQPYAGTTRAAYGASRGYPAPFTCLKDYIENPTTHQNNANGGTVSGGISAAQIIKSAADTYSISPKSLIVLLEKEQGLVTDDWPWTIQYRSATGYGCPDTAPCDAEYYGLYNQVMNAARQFRRYATYPNEYRYKAHQDNFIQYNPNAACSGTNVYIQNQATAGFYNYTPYQPNASALANLYGSGDSCGAYGNRNFWRLFNDWFGRSAYNTFLMYAPAAVDQAPGKINVFARGVDGRLWQNWYVNGAWQANWNYIDGPSPQSSAPSAISWNDGHMDVFETRNGEIWHNWYSAAEGWHGEQSLGRPASAWLGGSMTAVAQAPGKINVFARGNDGRLWQTWYSDGHWQGWNYIDGPSPASLSPSAVSWADGHMDVFEVRNGNVWHSWYAADGIGWRGWQPIGRPVSSNLTKSVAVVSQSVGKINLFAQGEDGRMWQNWYDGHNWQTNWNYIDGQLPSASAPSAVSWNDGHMDVFEVNNGGLRHSWFNADATGWRTWQELGRP